MLALEGYM